MFLTFIVCVWVCVVFTKLLCLPSFPYWVWLLQQLANKESCLNTLWYSPVLLLTISIVIIQTSWNTYSISSPCELHGLLGSSGYLVNAACSKGDHDTSLHDKIQSVLVLNICKWIEEKSLPFLLGLYNGTTMVFAIKLALSRDTAGVDNVPLFI